MKRVKPTGQCELYVHVGVRCPRPALYSWQGFYVCKEHRDRHEGFVTSELVKQERMEQVA